MKTLNVNLFIVLCLVFQAISIEVTLYGGRTVKPRKMRISSSCQKIPKEISANLRYVYTNNNCVLLWEDDDCKLNSLPIVTKENENMPALNFEDMFSSISDCSKSQSQLQYSEKNAKSIYFF